MRSALIVVDLQNDFLPGGALAVPAGDEVIAPANRLMDRCDTVVLTADWHPRDHVGFYARHPGRRPYDVIELPYGPQTLWPEHCVAGTPGAAFAPGLATERADLILRKGRDREVDSYSAFLAADRRSATGLAGWLRERGVDTLYVCGLATDFCVSATALDGAAAGFAVSVVLDACRAIDLDGSLAAARRAWREAGVRETSGERLAAAAAR